MLGLAASLVPSLSRSAVLTLLQRAAEIYVSGDFFGAWAVDTWGSRRMPLHILSRGEAWLHVEGDSPRSLAAGDLVFFPRDEKHIMASSAAMPAEQQINAGLDPQQPPGAHLSCGFFEFNNPAAWPLLDFLPPIIVLDISHMSAIPPSRTLTDLMIGELQVAEPGFYASINKLAHLLFMQIIRQ
ncbi:MAG: AraC family transcriptional activator of mtrCDE [Halioglobus sp.]|jgi:AraC family transcriptional activator of mtrCDE